MKYTLIFLLIITLFETSCTTNNAKLDIVDSDSLAISEVSSKFYNWYLANLELTGGAIEKWEDEVLVIQSDQYFKSLKILGIVTTSFLDSERARFSRCQEASKKIAYDKVIKCGCSIGMLIEDCMFFTHYYWIWTNEVYKGFIVDKVSYADNKSLCILKFYYQDDSTKWIDPDFRIIISLKKVNDDWLINEIVRERTAT